MRRPCGTVLVIAQPAGGPGRRNGTRQRIAADVTAGTLRHACGPVPQVGVWTHLAGVYDAAAGEARLYVNGSRVADVEATSWLAEGPFLIGRTLDGNHGDRFPGTIDTVRA
jgi:hypothetical protein